MLWAWDLYREMPSCWAAQCLIAGSPPSWSVHIGDGPCGVGMALGQPP